MAWSLLGIQALPTPFSFGSGCWQGGVHWAQAVCDWGGASVPGFTAGNGPECPPPLSHSPGPQPTNTSSERKRLFPSAEPEPFYLKTFIFKRMAFFFFFFLSNRGCKLAAFRKDAACKTFCLAACYVCFFFFLNERVVCILERDPSNKILNLGLLLKNGKVGLLWVGLPMVAVDFRSWLCGPQVATVPTTPYCLLDPEAKHCLPPGAYLQCYLFFLYLFYHLPGSHWRLSLGPLT